MNIKSTLSYLGALSLLSISALASAADSKPKYVTYLTSWGVSEPETINLTKADVMLLAFGKWDSSGNIVTSDAIADIPKYDAYWLPPSYQAWTQWKLSNPQKHVMIAFGGQTYEAIWDLIQTPEQREIVAKNLVALSAQSFPVYKKGLTQQELAGECLNTNSDGSCNFANYQLAGYVKIDGFDFDFEKSSRISAEESSNLLALTQRIRELTAPETMLSLTTYHVGADPVACSSNTVFDGCSYTEEGRSEHNGEVTDLLKQSANLFNFFDVMAYDAGKNFNYGVALNNYAAAVGDKSKIVLGLTNNKQWSPEGSFVQSQAENIKRTEWEARNGFGGVFLWAMGSNSESLTMGDQVNGFNEVIESDQQQRSTM